MATSDVVRRFAKKDVEGVREIIDGVATKSTEGAISIPCHVNTDGGQGIGSGRWESTVMGREVRCYAEVVFEDVRAPGP